MSELNSTMPTDIIHIKSITELHNMMGFEKPKHPLISVVDVSKLTHKTEFAGVRMSADFYLVSLKEHDCGMTYGRNYYDFEEGTLIFTAPNQVISTSTESVEIQNEGWMLFFHPDLIRGSSLGTKIDTYSFFSYEANEALHLSDQEKKIISDCVRNIEFEYNTNIDGHSKDLFVTNLELLLNYSKRFYDRQFHTRTTQQKDVLHNSKST